MDTNIKNNVNINGTAVLRDPQVIPIAVSATEDSVTIDIDAGLAEDLDGLVQSIVEGVVETLPPDPRVLDPRIDACERGGWRELARLARSGGIG